MKKLAITVFLLLLITAAAILLLYPVYSRETAAMNQDRAVRYYLDRAAALPAARAGNTLSRAERYNAALTELTVTDVFSVSAPESDLEVPLPEETAEATPVPTETPIPEPDVEVYPDYGTDAPEVALTPEPTLTPGPTEIPTQTPEPTETPTPFPEYPDQTEDIILHTPVPTAERQTLVPQELNPETPVPADQATGPAELPDVSEEPATARPDQKPVDAVGGSEGILLHPEAGPEGASGSSYPLPAVRDTEEEGQATPEPPRTEILRYQDQLKDGGSVMGVLEIPKISVRLPYYHGRSGRSANTDTVHVEGTSLPIGGPGLSVIAGPGELPAPDGFARDLKLTGARMLEDLGKLTGGDLFILRTEGRTFVYRVSRVWSVSPNALAEITADGNRDQVILMTARENQRLLVRGERIEIPGAQKALDAADRTEVPPDWQNILVLGAPVLLFGLLVMLAIELIRRRAYRLPTEKKNRPKKAAVSEQIPQEAEAPAEQETAEKEARR